MKLYEFILPFVFVFLLTAAATRFLYPRLAARKLGQKILEIGPAWHRDKEGTPTMGGLAFLAVTLLFTAVSVPVLLFRGEKENAFLFLTLILYAAMNAAIGIFDDSIKLRKSRNEGLSPFQKLFLQTVAAALFLVALHAFFDFDDEIYIPFLDISVYGGLLYDFLVIFLLLGITNCTNLTDGIDGLCSSVTAVFGFFYAAVAFLTVNYPLLFSGVLLSGIPLGFLIYNRHPAQIFMGDTGSLFLGALFAGSAVISRNPLLLLPLGFVYETEGVSDVLQVAVYKLTGKRFFRMAPFHHHLEKCGLSENKIVVLFTAIAVLSAVISAFGIRLAN